MPAVLFSTYVPIGYDAALVSVVFCVNIRPHQSLHPSPIPPDWIASSALAFAGPPVRRFDTPWPNSWTMIWLSRSPSRLGVVPVKTYICIRPDEPSGGVEKFALLVPDPSCASACTASL